MVLNGLINKDQLKLHDELIRVLYSTVEDYLKKNDRVVIAFSGGVDSTLLAKICHDLKKQTFLITVGFPNSHDVLFSKIISKSLSLSNNHIIYESNTDEIIHNFRYVKSKISCNILSHIENCIVFFQIAKIIKENNLGDFFLTANGFDELFCGYDRYRSFYLHGDETSIIRYMDQKLENEFHLMSEISKVTCNFEITSIQPFLSDGFIEFAKKIPIDHKIKGPNDMIRKHILREVALRVGVPEESARHPKKALQYGSLLHKYLLKNKAIFGL